MADLKEEGFAASAVLVELSNVFSAYNETEKKNQIKKTNGIFELRIKNDAGKEAVWTIDMKKTGTVSKGPAKPKADVTIIMTDETFSQLASGKIDGQKAFMTGKLKTKGNMMLATKLDALLKSTKPKAKL